VGLARTHATASVHRGSEGAVAQKECLRVEFCRVRKSEVGKRFAIPPLVTGLEVPLASLRDFALGQFLGNQLHSAEVQQGKLRG
jgi:hypothetical protein